jgi:ribonuclease BN (tRNA processing enzyme)
MAWRTVIPAALWATAVLLLGCGGGNPPASQATAADSSGARVVLLGTGTPNAEPDRSGPAVAVIVDGRPYLVDAGPGVVRQAHAARDRGVAALDAPKLDIVFLTHLHSDHTLGLPDLLFTPWVLGRERPLTVYGPPGTDAMVRHLREAYAADVQVRLGGLEPANRGGHRADVHEIAPGLVYQDERVRVTAFRVRHGAWEHAFGFRFEARGRAVVISGDATPSESVVEHCDGCDVLVHEVYSQQGFERREPRWQAYHAQFHTSSRELAQLAGRARPRLLVLYHQLLWGTTPDALVDEVAQGWGGQVVYGRDLDVY